MTDAYVRTTYQGHTVNRRTAAILEVFNSRTGESSDALMSQGSYSSSVPQSAGTHDGGGAFDLSAFNWRKRVRVLRALGVAAWHRPLNWDGRGGSEHIHCECAGDKEMSAGGRAQLVEYANHEDGLADHARDTFPFHPKLVPFNYKAWQAEQTRRRRLARALTGAIKKLVQARANAHGELQRKGLSALIAKLRKQRAAATH